MNRFEKHIFVCENVRPKDHPSGCCSEKGSREFRQILKKRLKELGLNTQIRANSAGCLDTCEHGVTVVIYPEQVWYNNVTKDDVEEIIQKHIVNNQPVNRLMIKNNKFNKDAS